MFETTQCDRFSGPVTDEAVRTDPSLNQSLYLAPGIARGHIICRVSLTADGQPQMDVRETVPSQPSWRIFYGADRVRLFGIDDTGEWVERVACRPLGDGENHFCGTDLALGDGVVLLVLIRSSGVAEWRVTIIPEGLLADAPEGLNPRPLPDVFAASDVSDRAVRTLFDDEPAAMTFEPNEDGSRFIISDPAQARDWMERAFDMQSHLTVEVEVALSDGRVRGVRRVIGVETVQPLIADLQFFRRAVRAAFRR